MTIAAQAGSPRRETSSGPGPGHATLKCPPVRPGASTRADRQRPHRRGRGTDDRRRRRPSGCGGRQGRARRPQRRGQDHAAPGARRFGVARGWSRRAAEGHGLPVAGSAPSTPCPTTRAASSTCSPVAGSTSCRPSSRRRASASTRTRPRRTSLDSPISRSGSKRAGGYAAESEVRALAAGVGLADDRLDLTARCAVGRRAPPARARPHPLHRERAPAPRRADEPPRRRRAHLAPRRSCARTVAPSSW